MFVVRGEQLFAQFLANLHHAGHIEDHVHGIPPGDDLIDVQYRQAIGLRLALAGRIVQFADAYDLDPLPLAALQLFEDGGTDSAQTYDCDLCTHCSLPDPWSMFRERRRTVMLPRGISNTRANYRIKYPRAAARDRNGELPARTV